MENNFVFFHDFLIWSLVCFGITFSITHSQVFEPVRRLAYKIHEHVAFFFHCPMCMGFWVGLCLGAFWESVTQNIILDGFLGLSVSWLIYCVSWKLALQDPNV